MYNVVLAFTNIDDLRMVRGGLKVAATIMGENYPLSGNYTIYTWDNTTWASESLPDIVWPTDPDTMAPSTAIGRWIKVEAIAPGQVNSDWNATTGVATILNKPTLFSGAYSDLTGKPTYAAVATSGSYNDLTSKPSIPAAQVASDWNAVSGVTQVLNKPTLPTTPSQSSASRSLNAAFQINTTRAAMVTYAGSITTTANIAGGQDGTIILEIASDSGFTANVQTLSSCRNSQVYTLAVAIQGVQQIVTPLHGWVPAGYYVRLRTVSTTGTPTFSFVSGQEVLF